MEGLDGDVLIGGAGNDTFFIDVSGGPARMTDVYLEWDIVFDRSPGDYLHYPNMAVNDASIYQEIVATSTVYAFAEVR